MHDRALFALIPGAAFAALAATDRGKRWIDEHTTETVMLGCGAVLLVLRFALDRASWHTVVRAFVLAGSPLAMRGLWRRFSKHIDRSV